MALALALVLGACFPALASLRMAVVLVPFSALKAQALPEGRPWFSGPDTRKLPRDRVPDAGSAVSAAGSCPLCAFVQALVRADQDPPASPEALAASGNLIDIRESLAFLSRRWLEGLHAAGKHTHTAIVFESPDRPESIDGGELVSMQVALASEDVNGGIDRWSRFDITLAFIPQEWANDGLAAALRPGELFFVVSNYRHTRRIGGEAAPRLEMEWLVVEDATQRLREAEILNQLVFRANRDVKMLLHWSDGLGDRAAASPLRRP